MEIDVLTLHYKQNHYPQYTVREGGYCRLLALMYLRSIQKTTS